MAKRDLFCGYFSRRDFLGFLLKVLQALHPLALQPTELLASLTRSLFSPPNSWHRFLAITVLLDVKAYLKSDHSNGGGS